MRGGRFEAHTGVSCELSALRCELLLEVSGERCQSSALKPNLRPEASNLRLALCPQSPELTAHACMCLKPSSPHPSTLNTLNPQPSTLISL